MAVAAVVAADEVGGFERSRKRDAAPLLADASVDGTEKLALTEEAQQALFHRADQEARCVEWLEIRALGVKKRARGSEGLNEFEHARAVSAQETKTLAVPDGIAPLMVRARERDPNDRLLKREVPSHASSCTADASDAGKPGLPGL